MERALCCLTFSEAGCDELPVCPCLDRHAATSRANTSWLRLVFWLLRLHACHWRFILAKAAHRRPLEAKAEGHAPRGHAEGLPCGRVRAHDGLVARGLAAILHLLDAHVHACVLACQCARLHKRNVRSLGVNMVARIHACALARRCARPHGM